MDKLERQIVWKNRKSQDRKSIKLNSGKNINITRNNSKKYIRINKIGIS